MNDLERHLPCSVPIVFLVGGRGGNASYIVAPEGTVCGTPARLAGGSSRLWTDLRLTCPLKPSYVGEPGHIL